MERAGLWKKPIVPPAVPGIETTGRLRFLAPSVRTEHVSNCFQVLHAVNLVRFEIAAFGPFIPAVDGQDAWTVGTGQQLLFGFLQSVTKPFGRVPANRIGKRK